MKFLMEARLLLSDRISEEDLKEGIEAVKPVLSKGVPKGKKGCEILEYKLEDKAIYLKLQSGRYVRPHDAILRINKRLSAFLGKKRKVGIREIIVDRYEIEYELEKKPLNEIKLPFVDEIKFEDKKVFIKLKDIDVEALEKKYVDRLLRRLEEKINQQYILGKAEFSRVVKQSEPKLHKYKFKKDPTEELARNLWVKHFARGVWIILPSYASLMRAIEELVVDKIAKELGFLEVFYPKIIPLEVMLKKGQLAGIPNEILWVCPPKTRDISAWQEYIDYVKITGKTAPEKLYEMLDYPEFGLAYAQCEPFYEIFAKKTIDIDKLPLKFYDRYGPTYRHESGGLKGLERLTEFKRIEFTWIGSKEDVINIRDEVRDKAVEIIDRIFDLEWKLEATTAVYLEHAGEKEEVVEKDYARTYDLTVKLPFETASKKEKDLEIASFHVHEDFYAKRFKWKERKKREIWSGCAGISPSRWAYVFIVRHGMNYEDWPKEIKKYIGKKLPEFPKDVFVD